MKKIPFLTLEKAKEIREQIPTPFHVYDEAGIRADIDLRSEKIGYKIREAQLQRVPYMLVIGEKESEDGTVVAVRSRDKGDLGSCKTEEFIATVLKQNADKQD